MRLAKKEKNILVPKYVHPWPMQENSEKKSQKIKKPLSDIIFNENGMR